MLITSRRRSDVYDVEVAVELLGEREAADLLQSWGGSYAADREAAEAICRRVDYLPLAVTLAGSYLHESEETAAGYLAWLEEAGLAALGDGHHRQESVRVLFRKSLAEVALWASEAPDIMAVLGRLALAPATARGTGGGAGNGCQRAAPALGQAGRLPPPCAARTATTRSPTPCVHEYAGELAGYDSGERWSGWRATTTRFAQTRQRRRACPATPCSTTARPHIMALLPRLEKAERWAALNESGLGH